MFKPLLMVRKAAILVPLILLFGLLFTAPAWATTVGNLTVTPVDNTVGAQTSYHFIFNATGGLNPGNEITITFDTGFMISSAATTDIVYLGGTFSGTVNANVEGMVLKISIPQALTVGANGPVLVVLSGVTNPTQAWDISSGQQVSHQNDSFSLTYGATPKTYTIGLATTNDSSPATTMVTFLPDTPAELRVLPDAGNDFLAGHAQTLYVDLLDQYGNWAPPATDVTVRLTDTDPQPNFYFGAQQEFLATIPAEYTGFSIWGDWCWVPKTPGTIAITAEDTAGELQTGSFPVDIAPPKDVTDLMVTPSFPNYRQGKVGYYTLWFKMPAESNITGIRIDAWSRKTDWYWYTYLPVGEGKGNVYFGGDGFPLNPPKPGEQASVRQMSYHILLGCESCIDIPLPPTATLGEGFKFRLVVKDAAVNESPGVSTPECPAAVSLW
ncbi:MAG: hypothetical protein K6U74_04850, partial [Firmicutes bacterium]|nr:hypothetical protein [Bacillota bacterium]